MKTLIKSPQNPNIKQIIQLKKANKRKKQGLIAIEGKKEIQTALSAGIQAKNLYFCPDLGSLSGIKLDQDKIIEVSPEIYQKISGREKPDGLLLLAEYQTKTLKDLKISQNPLILILERLEKPGNLGAIIRTADASGVEAIILTDEKTDIYHPNSIYASRGAIFTKQIVTAKLDEVVAWLKANKIKTYAATPEAKKNYTDFDYSSGSAILLGEESRGLSEDWLNNADEKIKIPMLGLSDSLNVSVSAGVLLYEVLRQRKPKSKV